MCQMRDAGCGMRDAGCGMRDAGLFCFSQSHSCQYFYDKTKL
ncbi:phosphotransferase [Vibrio coralliilyticus]|nr:phosphotransferase [Vibrio coralliilyticus]